MANKVLHKRNGTLNVAPAATAMTQGEIAMNYAKGSEKLYIKNSNNEIVSFPSSNELQEAERVTAASLIDLNDKIETISNVAAAAIADLNAQIQVLKASITAINEQIVDLYSKQVTITGNTLNIS